MSAMMAFDPVPGFSTDALAPVREICAVRVGVLTLPDAVVALDAAMRTGRHVKLAFANSHVVNIAADDVRFQRLLADFLVLPDGVGVDFGSWLLHGAPFPANLNGTDFIPDLLGLIGRPLRVGLIGAAPGVAERAAARLSALAPQHAYEALSHGYFKPAEEPALLERLAGARPDLLLVAFGNPLQEVWIGEKLGAQHCTVAAGVGALFDFLAGEVPRAPRWVRQLRLEWMFRLLHEPFRLWRRYVFGNWAFIMRVFAEKWRRLD